MEENDPGLQGMDAAGVQTGMNKKNLQRLIESIEEGHFSALDVNQCFGGHCSKLINKSVWRGTDNIKKFLAIPLEEAQNLFCGRDKEENMIFDTPIANMNSIWEIGPSEVRKQEALTHLRSLLAENG